MNHSSQPAILLLEDGNYFEGYAFGETGTTSGEICFNTGMTGYQEVFTDPSYYGQVLIMNSVHVGNYGVNDVDVESRDIQIKGLIARNLETQFSRYLAQGDLHEFLKKHKIVAIECVDTRALVTHIRTHGAMNCIISSDGKSVDELKEMMKTVPSMEGQELSSKVSTETPFEFGSSEAPHRVAVLDYGCKNYILESMRQLGIKGKVFPAKTSVQELIDYDPDGFFISNGPGDPAAMDYAVETIKELAGQNKPMFGICLGHQLLALAHGVKTFKMHHGHRGLNHPVKNLITGRSEITTQNHGFGVDPEDIKHSDAVEITHVNLNDDSIEGIRIKDKPFFSVQYHPESTPGPHDSRYLFDQFVELIENHKNTNPN